MLDEKHIREIKSRVTAYLKEGLIVKGKPEFVAFWLKKSTNSLETAKLLFKVSTEREVQDELGLPGFNGFLWVINASYYSMFFLVRALFEQKGIKIKTDQSIHSITFDILVSSFYLNKKIEKSLVEDFAEAGGEVSQTLEKEAKGLVEDYYFEKKKRGEFTYETGRIAMENKAKTSLNRAKKFNEKIRRLIK